MKKYVFIANSTKLGHESKYSREKYCLTNFSIPSIEAALSQGYQVFLGTNRLNPAGLDCDYDINLYFASIYRSLFDIRSNYVAFRNLMTLLREEKIEVIHCNTPIGGLLGRICGRLAGTNKIIYTVHGFHFYEGAPLINRTVYKWVETWLARYTDVIITINHEDYQNALQFKLRKGGKVYYVPGVGVNTEQYMLNEFDGSSLKKSLGLRDDHIVLIAVGDLVAGKNYATSLRAIARAANPAIHLLVCGTGPELDTLQRLARELCITNQVSFLGFRRDIAELLNISEIFLFTSFREGLPRSMMEAMAAGLPCIVSRIRGNVDLLEDGKGGYLFDPADVEGFARAINCLAEDEDLRKSMGSLNLETIAKFDVENVKKEMQQIFAHELP